jgi:hypothetical protein
MKEFLPKQEIKKEEVIINTTSPNSIANRIYPHILDEIEKKLNVKFNNSIEMKNNFPKINQESEYENVTLDNLKPGIEEVLKYKFSRYTDYLSKDTNALPLIANLANMYSKTINYNLYDIKDLLLFYIAKNDKRAWSHGDGIIYVETDEGQVSFHVFNGQDDIANKYGLNSEGREWSQEEVQFLAENLLYEYVKKHFSKIEKQEQLENIEKMFETNSRLKRLKLNFFNNNLKENLE